MYLNYDVFLSLKVVLILANSADPDEMQHDAAFHLNAALIMLHFIWVQCLPKYQLRVGIQYQMFISCQMGYACFWVDIVQINKAHF